MARAKISSSQKVIGGGGVQVVGVPELIAKLNAMNTIARVEVGYMMSQAAAFITMAAIDFAPERTGNLKTSIQPAKIGPYTWVIVADTTTGSDPGQESKNSYEYAGYVEYGTSRTPAQPFMAPAVQLGNAEVAASLAALASRLNRL
jgi:HK97 gp10 family phage protein